MADDKELRSLPDEVQQKQVFDGKNDSSSEEPVSSPPEGLIYSHGVDEMNDENTTSSDEAKLCTGATKNAPAGEEKGFSAPRVGASSTSSVEELEGQEKPVDRSSEDTSGHNRKRTQPMPIVELRHYNLPPKRRNAVEEYQPFDNLEEVDPGDDDDGYVDGETDE